MQPKTEQSETYAAMRQIIEDTLKNHNGLPAEGKSTEQLVCDLAFKLEEAGFRKEDPSLKTFIDQLCYSLKDFQKTVDDMIEQFHLLELTRSKARQISTIIEETKERI